ncbi:peptidylprolyl isomerase [Brevundimonas terrae]|uniref:peptidylprolyl isomerase n=2 Tax=Brevundimonas terrae TaxID=363631 RepID=A0ABP3I749_9CAUL
MKPVNLVAAALVASFGFSPALADPVGPDSDYEAIAPENLLVIDTTKGRIWVEMTPDIAPLHVERIRLLAGEGFYDNVKWHRVIDGFMAQTGDPTGTGEGGSTHGTVKAELTFRRGPETPFEPVAHPAGYPEGFHHSVPVYSQPDRFYGRFEDGKVTAWGMYCPGVAGMARDTDENSADSQFFFMRDVYPSLDRRYSIWGRVVAGQDVVNALKAGDLPSGMVTDPDIMTKVQVASAIPEGERPSVYRLRPDSRTFRGMVATVRQARGADFSPCDIQIPVRIEP